jgi:acyl-coenzyme A synthetase/AMP-(fatty) acid ligase
MKASAFEVTDIDDLNIPEIGKIVWDDLVYVYGQWVGLSDIASVLTTHESVAIAQVAAVHEREFGKSLLAYIVLNEGYTPSDVLIKELGDYVRDKTNPCVRFKNIEFVTYIPPEL